MIKRICIVVASEMTVTAFLKEHILALGKHYDVTLVVNTKRNDLASRHGLPVKVVPIAIERNISPVADALALYRLIRLFRRSRFDLVHSVTPKAGLLAMLAGKYVGIRFRVHTFTGQVWATHAGISRQLLKMMDRTLAWSATHLLADSGSQRQFLIEQHVASPGKVSVLADGSISGVNTERFKPDIEARANIRRQLGIKEEEPLLLFVGRLNRDKGVMDLAAAFAMNAEDCPQLHLLLVGPDETGMREAIEQRAAACIGRLHFVDFTDSPEAYFTAADIFCLPSYREGFGTVIIEAAACGVPAIGSRIYGISDAIREGESGLLFQAGNVKELAEAIQRLVVNSRLRMNLGQGALERARRHFPVERLVQAWLDYYGGLQ